MTYNIFISHSWSYGNQYEGLIRLLKQDSSFDFKDYSVPKDDPLDAHNSKQIRDGIRNHMGPASCVIILAGVYATYSDWISAEIEIAKSMGKKIIAVEYWGAERTSSVVKQNADAIVRWNSSSIINAIKTLCK